MSSFLLDPRVRLHLDRRGGRRAAGQLVGGMLVGGQPTRVLRLGGPAAAAVARWRTGPAIPADRADGGEVHGLQVCGGDAAGTQVLGDVGGCELHGDAELRLARRLHDAGLGILRVDPGHRLDDVTVVVPVRDRADELARCLATIGQCGRLLVIDDGSCDAGPVAEVAQAAGAELLRRATNGGPAAARNTGLAAVRTPLVAFVDSDCTMPEGWLEELLPSLLAGTAVVAPRIVGAGGGSLLARFERGGGPLDLGPRAAPVRPGGRVGYLPAAVLLCRRDELGAGFDPELRVGEDVDLMWRLAEAGYQVRYVPSVVVRHQTRAGIIAWVRQRHGYGRSAALLDLRHPGALTPARLSRWSLPGLVAMSLGRWGWLAAAVIASSVGLRQRLPDVPGRTLEATRLAAEGQLLTVLGLAHALARPWLPATVGLAVGSRRARRLAVTTVAVQLLRAAPNRSRDLDPLRWALLHLADDLAYASGVWRGACAYRRPGVLLPQVR